jgi:hypothetical protein
MPKKARERHKKKITFKNRKNRHELTGVVSLSGND